MATLASARRRHRGIPHEGRADPGDERAARCTAGTSASRRDRRMVDTGLQRQSPHRALRRCGLRAHRLVMGRSAEGCCRQEPARRPPGDRPDAGRRGRLLARWAPLQPGGWARLQGFAPAAVAAAARRRRLRAVHVPDAGLAPRRSPVVRLWRRFDKVVFAAARARRIAACAQAMDHPGGTPARRRPSRYSSIWRGSFK